MREDFYDSPRWQDFDLGHPGGVEASLELLRLGALRRGARVLDLCCGTGETVALAREEGLEAFGVDRSAVVWRARDRHFELSERFLEWSGGALPMESGSLDAVICECSLSLLDRRAEVLEELRRVLRRDGRFLVADFFDGAVPRLAAYDCLWAEDRSSWLKDYAAAWLWRYGRAFPCEQAGRRYFAAVFRPLAEGEAACTGGKNGF